MIEFIDKRITKEEALKMQAQLEIGMEEMNQKWIELGRPWLMPKMYDYHLYKLIRLYNEYSALLDKNFNYGSEYYPLIGCDEYEEMLKTEVGEYGEVMLFQ